MSFISAHAPRPLTVVYLDEHGTETVYEGGSRAWRNCNPGNIVGGTFAEAHGAIGQDSRFAIFPDPEIGFQAIIALLRTQTYQTRTLEEAINRYAPPHENDSDGYVRFVTKRTGLAKERRLADMSNDELAAFAGAIKVIEGWKPGSIRASEAAPEAGDDALAPPVSSAAPAAQDWMNIAWAEASRPSKDRSEWAGSATNPRIMEYFKVGSSWFLAQAKAGGDEVDWCAAFVNFCLETAGYTGTRHPGARSFYWQNKHFIRLQDAQPGCIAVFRDRPFDDPKWDTGSGHVGFVIGATATTVTLLGGNQANTVREQTFQREYEANGKITRRLEAFVMPAMN
jgi:uncharacterized protein (TIGR02594 family)